ncbi:AfsR/SARP family transcriptional regulator [Nonomuraea angiospora]|uniref:AfsR/SARP family transcriptional regulator n=1 Tax=Nonomuraea angiospora TaxID=46172 RepID=UPI0029BAF95F|nr:BTAD domain-containing putative transcriptional regulator [Nonomuraea angiospora]MDX3100864.1 BTAD domain-containing putative transcriptional regulator [Nonomuraea angiospora]
MRFRILGPITVSDESGPVELSAAKIRTLLAVLLLSRSRIVSDSWIAEMLWGEDLPTTSEAQIQIYVSRLRQKLGVSIARQRPGYLMEADPDAVDLLVFEKLARQGRQLLEKGAAGEAARVLGEALSLWRGPALSGATDLLTAVERPRLEEAKLATLEDRVDADLRLGGHTGLVSELTGLVSRHPWRERLRGQLMLALYRSGRQADAINVYEDLRGLLADDLSTEPSQELRELYGKVLVGDPALDTAGERAAVTTSLRPGQLPPDVGDFTGRSAESAEISASLGRKGGQGVTVGSVIGGMAGVGKTSLAVHVAYQVLDRYPDGQLFVDLGGLQARPLSPFDALGEMLLSLGVDPSGVPASFEERVRLYRSRMIHQRIMVVLDNAAGEQQVRPLLPPGPRSAVLVTGRARLVLAGIPGLDLDMLAEPHAVTLLSKIIGTDRVQAEPKEAERIAAFCGHLPLGVRLAGMRLVAKPHWSLRQFAQRLASPRRRLAELGAAGITLRDRLNRSYLALAQDTQRALRLLVLLDVPAFTLWMAAVVLDTKVTQARDLIEQLLDARLLDSVPGSHGMSAQYRFHPLVRALALDYAVQEDSSLDRQAALARMTAASIQMDGIGFHEVAPAQ